MKRLITAFVFFQIVNVSQAQGVEMMSELTKEIERVNGMRENLVSGVQGEVSPEVFKAVCKPVGKELKKLSKRLGVQIKQTSFKYRNPNHKPDALEQKTLKVFASDKDLISFWKSSSKGNHYFRRINIQEACLNCHGAKSSRPSFIKKKYPLDKAFDFKEGDLRGIYSVFISNEKFKKNKMYKE